jgi:hypothetical protein
VSIFSIRGIIAGGALVGLGAAIVCHQHDPPHAEESSQPDNSRHTQPSVNIHATTNTTASAILMFDLEASNTADLFPKRVEY